jgi:hypothetical protein
MFVTVFPSSRGDGGETTNLVERKIDEKREYEENV